MWKFLLIIFAVGTASCAHKSDKACCGSEPVTTENEVGEHGHHQGHKDQPMSTKATYSENSLYNVRTSWENQSSNNLTLASFKGVPVILTMTYTSCQYSCPLTLKKLEEIEKRIKQKGFTNYKIVIISFDTVRDTPERFTQYIKEKKLDSNRYVFLRARDKSKVREIAVHLGINYKEESGNEYSHSNVITLLNTDGVIAQQINGIGGDPTDLINKLVQMK